jgi:hypothetical protein
MEFRKLKLINPNLTPASSSIHRCIAAASLRLFWGAALLLGCNLARAECSTVLEPSDKESAVMEKFNCLISDNARQNKMLSSAEKDIDDLKERVMAPPGVLISYAAKMDAEACMAKAVQAFVALKMTVDYAKDGASVATLSKYPMRAIVLCNISESIIIIVTVAPGFADSAKKWRDAIASNFQKK